MKLCHILFIAISFYSLENAWAGRDLASMFGDHPSTKKCVMISSFPANEEKNTGEGGGLAPLHTGKDKSDEACIKKCDEFYQSRVESYGDQVSARCRIGENKSLKTYGPGPFRMPHKDGGYIEY